MSNSARLIRLEEELAFQEQKLEGLNEALLGQQKQLNKLELQLGALLAKMEVLLEQLDNAGGALPNEKPPHYL